MTGTKARRRRLALGVLLALAVAGFVVGAAVGGGSGSGGSVDSFIRGRPFARHDGGGRPSVREADEGSTASRSAGERTTAPREVAGSTAAAGAGERSTAGTVVGGSSLAEGLGPRELAGERVVVGLREARVARGLRAAIATGKVTGVVLFEAAFPTRAGGRALVRRLQAIPRPGLLRDLPLLVMADQEGGEVKRVDGAPDASAATMGREGPAYARRQGRLTATNLRSLGVDIDLAPVLDVGRPGGVIDETERAFAGNAAGVARTAVPFAEGLEAGGVAATAKHFPGLGAAVENTDFEAQKIGLSRATLRRVDMAPYRRFIAAGGRLVMLSTATYPALSPRPAAFSHEIATGELRGRLGFRGVTITDSLGGAAVADFGGQREAAVDGAAAGDDLLLFDDLPSALAGHDALVTQLREGGLRRRPFYAAVGRVLRLSYQLRRLIRPGSR